MQTPAFVPRYLNCASLKVNLGCESVWPPNASLYASSTCVHLRPLAGLFDQGITRNCISLLSAFFSGPSARFISSNLAFLFSINNVLGLEPVKIDVKESNKTSAAFNDPSKGPVFGLQDLTIAYNDSRIPRESESHIGNAYSLPEGYGRDEVYGCGLLAETRVFTWDDLEVFYYDGK